MLSWKQRKIHVWRGGSQTGRWRREGMKWGRGGGLAIISCNTSERILFAAWKVLSLRRRGKTAPGHGDVRALHNLGSRNGNYFDTSLSIRTIAHASPPPGVRSAFASDPPEGEKRTFYNENLPARGWLTGQILMVTLDAGNNEDTKCSIQRWQLLDYTTRWRARARVNASSITSSTATSGICDTFDVK